MNPLFLPKGTIRAILVLGISAFGMYAIFHKIELPELFTSAWLLALGYYFGIRSDFNKEN